MLSLSSRGIPKPNNRLAYLNKKSPGSSEAFYVLFFKLLWLVGVMFFIIKANVIYTFAVTDISI